jgi:SAM-dependent methyltransferase
MKAVTVPQARPRASLTDTLRAYNPLYRLATKLRMREAAAFDLRFDIDTEKPVFLDELSIPGKSTGDARFYVATPVRDLKRLIRKAPIELARFTFLDLGCGKGRALMLADDAGFRGVIGVEADSHLSEIADANARRWAQTHPGSTPIQIINCDAREYHFPAGNLFVYLSNPFEGAVLDTVLANLVEASKDPTRELVIAYNYNVAAERIDATGAFERRDLRPRLPWRRSTVSYHLPLRSQEEVMR